MHLGASVENMTVLLTTALLHFFQLQMFLCSAAGNNCQPCQLFYIIKNKIREYAHKINVIVRG